MRRDVKILLIIVASILVAVLLYVAFILIYSDVIFRTPHNFECEHCHIMKYSRIYHVTDIPFNVCEDCYKAYERGEWSYPPKPDETGVTDTGSDTETDTQPSPQ